MIIKKVIDLLKMAGIDASQYIGKVDPSKVKLLISKNQKTATKPKLISALHKDKGTFSDALNVFENDAKYLSQMNEMELTNFANNLHDYFKVGGKVKWKPSNVVTTEGAPVVGKKLETLAARKGAAEADTTSLEGAMKGLGALIDEIKGISPKMRNQMDRDELVAFIKKMRGRDFTNQEIRLVRDYMDEWGIGLAKEKAAPAMAYAKKLGAKDKEEFKFIEQYLDDIETTSPEKFREMFDVKKINMDISDTIDKKLEKHIKKKYKWDDTKKDGGLDDATFTKYEDELYDTQKEFGDFHTVYDTHGPRNIWGRREGTSWVNNPKNYLDEASEKLQSITGEGLNTNFWKNYTDEVLGKYPKPEKFQYGGIAGMLGEPTYQDEDHRVPYQTGLKVYPKASVRIGEQGLGNDFGLGTKDTTYGGTLIGEKDGLYGGIDYLKIKNKIDFMKENQTLFKDTTDDEKIDFIFGKKGNNYDIRFKTDKDFDNKQVTWNWKFNEGGRVPYNNGKFVEKEDLPSGLKAEVGDPTPGWGLSDLVSRYFLYKEVLPGVSETTQKYLTDKLLKDLNDQGYSAKDFKAYIDEQFPGKAGGGRVPLKWGKRPISAGIQVLDPDFDDEDFDMEELIKELIRSTQERWRDKYQTGGRAGYKDGSKMSRRTFLKGLGALAALPVVGKFFKFAKPAAKVADLTQIPIKNADGMPSWFKPLVNRVIKEGTDTTNLPIHKGGALAEREIVHSAKLGENQGVRVYQNLDNQTITVEYQSVDNMGGVNDGIVRLEYKAAEEVATKKGSVKTKPTFEAEEAWPHGTTGDYKDITMEGSNVVNKVDDLYSDTSALKQFGTNKALTKKELEIAKQKQKRVNEINNDLSEQSQLLPEPPDPDFASGGRVPMVFGGRTIGVLKNLLTKFKKSSGIPRGEKTLKPDVVAKRLMSEEDKLKLLQFETQYANSVLEQLKLDRRLFQQLETNKAMKDQGLDFLMKNFVETQAPHMKNYKSLADMDQAILELETLVKNKTLKEGRQLNASGGRVSLSSGGVAGMLGE